MLHRTKKKGDGNEGKWLGIGGHFEEKESPYDCVIREVKEETGLTLLRPKYRGIVTFASDEYKTEQMHLFTCTEFIGELGCCSEGDLYFVEKSRLRDLPMWEGDFLFLELLDTREDFFVMKLEYRGDALVGHTVY